MSGFLETLKKDYKSELEQIIRQVNDLVASHNLEEALQFGLQFEKKCRLGSDNVTLKEICVYLVQLCFDQNDFPKLNNILLLLNKKRNQSKNVITAIVEKSMGFLLLIAEVSIRTLLIKTLMEITDGKIYVEGESARLHMSMAMIHEAAGDINAACEVIQDVHVETYGSITKVDKAKYIIEQIRLNMLNEDYVRALIHSRKINAKTISEVTPEMQEVKLAFYRLMTEFHSREQDCYEICQCYLKMLEAPMVLSNEDLRAEMINHCAVYLVLSPHDNQVADLLARLLARKEVNETKANLAKQLLTLFTTKEVIPSPFGPVQSLVESVILQTQMHNATNRPNGEAASQLIATIRTRVIQHNVRVMAEYYSCVESDRMASMLQMNNKDELELVLSEMSSESTISASGSIRKPLYVKIDRPNGIISFRPSRPAEAVLTEWTGQVTSLLTLMENTCHLINRENMVHKM